MATFKGTPLLYILNNLDNNKMNTHSYLSELNSKSIKMMSSDYNKNRQFNDDSGHTCNSTVIIIVVHPYFTQTYRNTTCSKLCPTTAKQISNGMTHVRMIISHRDWAINRPNQ